jgi:hypothetical protein
MIFIDAGEPIKRGRGRPKSEAPANPAMRQAKFKSKRSAMKRRCIAVLDMETDPFDASKPDAKIFPFVACLYSDQFDPIFIWENDGGRFVRKVCEAIQSLPDEYTIYAHNGGRFDFLFLVSQLRGDVSFKGRGLMSARIGVHELRDSFNIIPEKLAAYRKDKFDYTKLTTPRREKHRKEILDYLLSDCVYLFELMRHFVDRHGLKLTIGQTAMGLLRKEYEVEKFTENWDRVIRTFFFGGRVECIRGRGDFRGDYKLFDVNSMYPYVMANYRHPIGGFFDYRMRRGAIRENTIFIDLTCTNDRALICRTDEKETVATVKRGRFLTTIWEFNVAIKYGLISDVHIHYCYDCAKRTDFSKFVLPIYEQKSALKTELDRLKNAGMKDSAIYQDTQRDYMFSKYLQNTGYGKFAQDPRRFKEHYLTDPNEMPPPEWFKSIEQLPEADRVAFMLPEFEDNQYWIWSKPCPGFRFNNVGTAASITGAARSVLLEALQLAVDPIYCDTDSIICRDLPGVEIHANKLGAWDLEAEFSKVLIWAKKGYACEVAGPSGQIREYKVRSKGSVRPTWEQAGLLVGGAPVELRNFAPTLDRYGGQEYGVRTIRATAPILEGDT